MPGNEETTIKFKLWAVLGFLVVLVGVGLSYLFIAQTSAGVERTDIKERVIRMEVNYQYVVQGISDLKQTQKEMMEVLRKQQRVRGE
uniref:Uncharacterized protein n=1 Tax=viral metagenome TaxID=1070528 RepID=A0A6M3L2M0_9ZZZZ